MPVRYDEPGVEPSIDNEAELTQEIHSLINRVQGHNFSMHRHGFRGTHVKVQGLVKGTLTVPELPEELAQGICAKPAAYDVAMRYANEPSFLQDDRAPGPRGCSMKVFSSPTQDFTFNNAPILELRDLATTIEIFRIREKHFREPEKIAGAIKQRKDKDLQMAPSQLPNQHFLSYTMYSQSAYRWGPYVVKYALFPTSKVPETPVTNDSDPEQHSQWLQEYFARNEMLYDLRVQLCEDIKQQPVEDASVQWNEDKYPFRTVAQVKFPSQDSFDSARRSFWDDHMKLNVWAGSDEHRPLGSVNRLRKSLYQESQKKRAKLNNITLDDVKTLDQIP
jgi:hypothetical protein